MFLCIVKVIMLIFFLYGVYASVLLIFDLVDSKRYIRCVYVRADKVSNIEDTLYTIFMRHPNTEIYIVYPPDTDSETVSVISKLCSKYDFVYSIEE